jgi:hypothetical protein
MTRPVVYRAIASLLSVSQLIGTTGCTSWKTQDGSAQMVLAAWPDLAQADTTVAIGLNGKRAVSVSYTSVRISTVAEPRMTEMLAPRVVHDTLFGTTAGNGDVTAIPLDQVTAVQVRKGNAAKTTGLIIGVAVGSFILVGLAVAATCEQSGIGSVC